jgi:thymidylate synthase
MTTETTTDVWFTMLGSIIDYGEEVSPVSAGADWRGRTSRELVAYRTVIPMENPVLRCDARKLSTKFLAGEAAWIASGDNRVATIKPFNKRIADFSDDGVRFFGAYGPRFVEQLSYVTRTLRADRASRQAVINIWREQPFSKDVPCNLSWQYLIRDYRIHMVASMRSSDAFTGWVYDVFNLSVTAAIVALELRKDYPDLRLGNLYLIAGSQHLYKLDRELTDRCLADGPLPEIEPLDLAEFAHPDQLIEHLWALAHGDTTPNLWLRELFP